jgi:hypothetical protein
LSPKRTKLLKQLIGFLPPDRLIASNKLVRIELAFQLARIISRLHRRRKLHFYWITVINEDWHSRHDGPEIDLQQIDRLIQLVLQPLDLNWLGMVEIDIFNNFPGGGKGLWIMPHGHLLAWSSSWASPKVLEAEARKQFLRSTLEVEPVVAKEVRSLEDLMHLCFYMTKPNYQCKSMGRFNAVIGRRKMYSVEKGVRPGLTLRISEILSRLRMDELFLARGEGHRIKRRLMRSTSRSPAVSHQRGDPLDVEATWSASMPPNRRSRSLVHIARPDKNGWP